MADWKGQYLTALKARDELEKADAALYNRCTKLADRNAELKAEVRNLRAAANKPDAPPPPTTTTTPVPAPLISYGFRRQTPAPAAPETETLAQLRQDFAKSQQDRADLQSQVDSLKKELEVATAKGKIDSKKISQLSASLTLLSTKLKDREEELRGKAKLLVNVQDENATLNLELNQAEQEVKRVKKENQELVDRWVARMGKEADRMNEQSNFS